MTDEPEIVVATQVDNVFITPTGVAHNMFRIGVRKDGQLIATAEMSDREIAEAGLTGEVRPASADANRLYP